MKYQKLSTRQNLAMTWWNRPGFEVYDGIICDGSIRSGKTVAMTVGFIMWAMTRFDGYNFAICGKTIESLRRNVTSNLPVWLAGVFSFKEHRTENKIVVSANDKSNSFYLFGGKDESSAALIQGITLAGILLDEVALMPESFVNQATARCSVEGAKLWFNCNPEGPSHWFYTKWVLGASRRKMLHLHFTMDDNLSLSATVKARYESLYSGVFYDRFIRGLWRVAEGLVYQFGEKNVTDEVPESGEYYISIDYGTLNPFSAGLWCVNEDKAVRIAEYYYSGRDKKAQKTDEEYCDEIEKLAGSHYIRAVIVDPSASSFITALRRRSGFSVRNANNDVLDGIRVTGRLLKNGKLKIHRSCKDAIREFGLYRWDDEKNSDQVIKENDHAMDDIRYMCNTVLRRYYRLDRRENEEVQEMADRKILARILPK
uniref:Large terminase n=1 Tax=Myoviridae sp. ct44j18 TaxID=2827600 RepID=A0A8S5RSJ9_9CAUD|nr:MAG TPA: large terminase [Myoviridae sp. ct44j18]